MNNIVTTLLLSISLSITSYETFAQSDHLHQHKMHHNTKKQNIAIHKPIIKITPPGITNSAGYFDIINHSDKDIDLINAKSNIAQRTEIHEHTMNNGIMKMQKVQTLTIPAKSTINFEPGGYHIMFISVNRPITEKQEIKLTLEFSDGSHKSITAVAKEPHMQHIKKRKHHGQHQSPN